MKLFWRMRKTLRVRLTAWYMLLLGCTLIFFSGYLYLQLKYSLLGQIDTTLKVAGTEVVTNLVVNGNRLSFNNTEQSRSNQQQLIQAGFVARVITINGKNEDGLGNYQNIQAIAPQKTGFQNFNSTEGIWRLYNLPLAIVNNQIIKTTAKSSPTLYWLQVAQSLESVTKALDRLLSLILLGFPLVLLFAGLGGLFLADRALSPINRIVRTAEAIHPDDLSYRINYQGVADEVGRLAMTLDRMLDRIELAFEHERRFIADASHELRTPLTVIKGRIGVTLSRQRTPTEYKTTLQDLEQQTDRLIRLTNGLLFLTRLEQEQLQGQESFAEVDLSSLLEVLIEQIQPVATDNQLLLQAKVIPNLIVLGDSDLLTSLFLNLLDNAVKYTPEGGQVHLITQSEPEKITVIISNSGRGIAAENLPYLFDRFYRVDRETASENNRSHHPQGNGLGLAIASLVARCHGGQISVSSQINQFTKFKVILPQPTTTDKKKTFN